MRFSRASVLASRGEFLQCLEELRDELNLTLLVRAGQSLEIRLGFHDRHVLDSE